MLHVGGEWRLKYERSLREIDFTKKRMQQEFEDKLEVEQQSKRQLERRLADLHADNEETQRTLQQLKKKCQRLTSELQDTKLHLEGHQGRNHELEKKQRRDMNEKDSEITVLTHKVDQLEVELQDLSSQESKDEASLAKVKKQLRDLEAKVKDQEEELDEQAGSIQMLEQRLIHLQ
ncbi:hypothetical protein AB205_0043240, partial [Aquarana catesbeiana]